MPLQNNNENVGAMFFAAYIGPSMIPTLREPEIMEITPYKRKPLRVGDVIFFLPPEADQPVVHRIVRLTSAGIATLGDNNAYEDAFLLQPESIKGRVTAAWRGQKRRKIAGGLLGRMTSRWLGSLTAVYRLCCTPSIGPCLTRGWSHACCPFPCGRGSSSSKPGAGNSSSFCWESVSSGATMTTGANGRSNGHFNCLWMAKHFPGIRITTGHSGRF
jgi:hypothetical protein